MNYKFIQPVSMQVTQEQYERDLREPLLAMGYKEYAINLYKKGLDYLITNHSNNNDSLTNLGKEHLNLNARYFIPDYNPKLFLAIAAMTDKECGICGEWWYCIKDVVMHHDGKREYSKGRLYMGLDSERIIDNSNSQVHYWERPIKRFEYFRKATLQELINKFTNQKQNIMKKELTQEQFEELKNLIAPENKEKFNKLFKVNKNAIEEDLMYESLGDNIPCMIADNIFDIEDEFKPYKENYYKRSLFVPSVCDVDFVKAKKGWTLIMFNKK